MRLSTTFLMLVALIATVRAQQAAPNKHDSEYINDLYSIWSIQKRAVDSIRKENLIIIRDLAKLKSSYLNSTAPNRYDAVRYADYLIDSLSTLDWKYAEKLKAMRELIERVEKQ